MHVSLPDQRRQVSATLVLVALLCCVSLCGCREPVSLADLQGDQLLLAPTARYLEARLELLEAGRLRDARDLWATRSLIPVPPPDVSKAEYHWWRQLDAASDRAESGRQDAQDLYRLARILNDVRWHREALVVARQAVQLDPQLVNARQMEEMLDHLVTFGVEADSVVRRVYSRARAGEAIEREAPRSVAALAASYGYTPESLRRRGLYLGRRAPGRGTDVWEAVLSVIADHRGATTIRRAEGQVQIRRVVLDDDRLTLFDPAGRSIWEAEPGIVAQGQELAIYHDRDAHRRAGMLLYAALEQHGGAAPHTLSDLDTDLSHPRPGGPPRPPDDRRVSTPDGADGADDSDPPPSGGRDWLETHCDTQLADALRLRAVVPIYDQAQARSNDDQERRRRFIRELMEERFDRREQRVARIYIDQLANLGFSEQRQEERLILDALLYAPLPRWELADLVAAACDSEAVDARAIASRSVLRYLHKTVEINEPDDWLRLRPAELRAAAERIAADRFGRSVERQSRR